MTFRRARVRAVMFGSVLVAATAMPAVQPAVAATNLVRNGGFEKLSGGKPQCWTTYRSGTNRAKFGLTKGAHGKRALKVAVAGLRGGERAGVQAPGCSIPAKPGQTFKLSVNYKSSTAKAGFVVFRHDAAKGWVRWEDLATLPVSKSAFRKAVVRTNAVPEGTDQIRFGVSLFGNGTLITDDFAAVRGPAAKAGACTDARGCQVGRWSTRTFTAPHRSIHSVLLHNGKVLMIAGSGSNAGNFKTFKKGSFKTYLYDPVTGKFKNIYTPVDLFCAGHVQLRDGKVLVMGGTLTYPKYNADGSEVANTGFRGLNASYYFDPATNKYVALKSKMADGHWYPSATILGNGDVFSAGGNSADLKKEISPYVEYYSAKQRKWLPKSSVKQNLTLKWSQYPSLVLMQNGQLFYTGSATYGDGIHKVNADKTKTFFGPGYYDIKTGQFNELPGGLRKQTEREYSASLLLPPAQEQKVVIMGGGNTWPAGPPGAEFQRDANRFVDIIDLNQAAPKYRPAAEDLPHGDVDMGNGMQHEQGDQGKLYVSAVILPDGKVLETGGGLHLKADPVYEASIFNPKNEKFQSVTPDPVPRLYHNTAVLLPDGRVLAAGSEAANARFDQRISIYSPPYLFKGRRPKVTVNSQKNWAYGSTQKFKVDQSIASASLIRPAAVTHSSDPNQRSVNLPIRRTGGGSATVKLDGRPTITPPGWYMLFVTNKAGVPSIAKWVHVG